MEDHVKPETRVARYLVAVTVLAVPPTLARERTPATRFRLLGDSDYLIVGDGVTPVGWSEVGAAHAELRAACDRVGGLWWVWVGHDQFLYRSDWAFFACRGPAGWVAPHVAASDASFAALARKEAAQRAAERKAAEVERERNRVLNAGRRGKKKTRNADAIVEQIDRSQEN